MLVVSLCKSGPLRSPESSFFLHRFSPSGATHILTSQQLSGSKTHKHLTSKARNPPHVVRPEWVFESLKAGRRLREWEFAVVKSESAMDLAKMFGGKKDL